MMSKKLRRSHQQRLIGGVCGGVAEYFDIDVTPVRLAWLLFALLEGAGIILYLAGWVIIPESKGGSDDA